MTLYALLFTHSPSSSSAAPVAPIPTTSPVAPIYVNSTAAAAPNTSPVASTGLLPTTTGASAAGATPFQGSADKAVAVSGLGLAGAMGLVAYLL